MRGAVPGFGILFRRQVEPFLDTRLRQACLQIDGLGLTGCDFALALVEEGGALQRVLSEREG